MGKYMGNYMKFFILIILTLLSVNAQGYKNRYSIKAHPYIQNQILAMNKELIIWSYPANAYKNLKYMTISYDLNKKPHTIIYFKGYLVEKIRKTSLEYASLAKKYYYAQRLIKYKYDDRKRVIEEEVVDSKTGEIKGRTVYQYDNGIALEYSISENGDKNLNRKIEWIGKNTLKITKYGFYPRIGAENIELKYFDKYYFPLKWIFVKKNDKLLAKPYEYMKWEYDKNHNVYWYGTIKEGKKVDGFKYQCKIKNGAFIESQYIIEKKYGKVRKVYDSSTVYRFFY
jgi:hypothetical protein